MSLYDKILMERISSEEQLSDAERRALTLDAEARNLLEENRMLEMARPRVWNAPERTHLLRAVYQRTPHSSGLFVFPGLTIHPGQLRRMVGSLAAVFVMLAVASYLYQISPRWEHSEGFDVSYEIPAVSSDVDYFARQMEGEAGNLAADLFHDDKSGVELLSVEKQTNGSLRAVFRLQGINNEELQGFDREFSRQHSATRTQLEPRSWYSTSRLPGHMFENREVTINNQQLSFPRAFSSTEVTSLDRLFSSVQGNEVIVRGLRIGNEQKISVAEVVSLELDDKGNVIIQDVAGSHAGKPVLDYSEFTPEAD